MAKATFDEQEESIINARNSVKFDTKEFTLELLHSKFNRRIEDGESTEIIIPFYQRNFVWTKKECSRFIESILLGLPIPPLFFAEVEDGILEVIDGSQRIRTINDFLNNELKLTGLEKLEQLNKLKFNDFSSSRKRKIKNSTIRSIVLFDLDQDTLDISYELFNRLNTGGKQLTKMEIIKGSQQGKFINFVFHQGKNNTLLDSLSQFSKDDKKRGYREEFLIKYFAFLDNLDFENSINNYLDNYIDTMNDSFNDDKIEDAYLDSFRKMLSFLDTNNLIKDLSTNKKNKLLAAYIGTTLALRENPNITSAEIFTEKFLENAKSNGFSKLKDNIELVKNTLLS